MTSRASEVSEDMYTFFMLAKTNANIAGIQLMILLKNLSK